MIPLPELSELVHSLKGHFSCTQEKPREFTIEVNPESLSSDKLSAYEQLGINRLSVGIQSFHSDILKKMGRLAKKEECSQALSLIKEMWKGSWSVDIIFGFPGQTKESQLEDIKSLLDHNPPHFSLYTLTVEEGTVIHTKTTSGQWDLPDEEEMELAWEEALILIQEAGYERYEISSFCKSGHQSQHNMAYWHMDDWIGLGCGGASLLKTDTLEGALALRLVGGELLPFMASTEEDLTSKGNFYQREEISSQDYLVELLMMGLRIKEGVSWDHLGDLHFKQKGSDHSSSLFSKEAGQERFFKLFSRSLKKWDEYMEIDVLGFRLTQAGLDWHSAIMVDLLLDLE